MSIRHGLFTSESVSAGHPDKVCDRISDSVLDRFLSLDPNARVACETLAADDKILVAGVGEEEMLGAGDQGLMFGYATRETPSLTPLAWTLATNLIERGTRLRGAGATPLRPDAKIQVTVRYADGVPIGVQAVVLSWQHALGLEVGEIRRYLEREIVDAVVPAGLRTPDFRLYCNPAGAWTIGGPKGDTGLTGRKIIVDTYGGACPHGGGAFSGKDPSKADRSGAYAARWVAKHIVAAGLAARCTVQVAYAIEHAVRDVLDLRRPIYADTAALGHLGPWRDPAVYRWERTDRIADPHRAFIAHGGKPPRNPESALQRAPVAMGEN